MVGSGYQVSPPRAYGLSTAAAGLAAVRAYHRRPATAIADAIAGLSAAAADTTPRRPVRPASAVRAAGKASASSAIGRHTRWQARVGRRTVVITGGCGNLGVKLAKHLLATTEYAVVLLEHPRFFAADRVPAGATCVQADLADPADAAWRDALRGADCLVHFSAVNPYPNADWAESAASMSHTFNAFVAASELGVRRVVFATSNHVMGRYKDAPEVATLHPTTPPRCGTFLCDPEATAKSGDAVPYAAAKLAGEQLGRTLAAASSTTTFVALRIGWCQPGANLPSTLNPGGCPAEYQTKVEGGGAAAAPPPPEADVDEMWFKSMWLSNGDFLRYFTAALDVGVARGELLLLNAMSANTGMRWSIAETEAALGVRAVDNSLPNHA